MKEEVEKMRKEMEEKAKQLDQMESKVEELELTIVIKTHEIDYYKGELEWAGIESDFSEASIEGMTPWEDYKTLYFKEKEKVTRLVAETRKLLDQIEQLKL